MRRVFGLAVAALGVAAVLALSGPPVNAQNGPSNRCYGQISAGIASTWPWAHDGRSEFPPPPGALRLWIEEFGPLVGISSVRELQQLFCD
jgi:hypothetical protein